MGEGRERTLRTLLLDIIRSEILPFPRSDLTLTHWGSLLDLTIPRKGPWESLPRRPGDRERLARGCGCRWVDGACLCSLHISMLNLRLS